MSKSKPQDRIREYFLSKGYSEDPINEDGFSAFLNGEYRTAVKVLSLEDLEDRNILLQSLLEAASKPRSHSRIYVAMPKLLASVIDGKILEEIGLGLLIYDERNVEEAIPAKVMKPKTVQKVPAAVGVDPSITRELQLLKMEISELRETVEKLKRELDGLRGGVKPHREEKGKREVKMEVKISSSQPSGLPSFFQDNPWLSVLSQRGKETGEIAS